MKIQYPDYENCIANLACSILNYYGIDPPNPTLPQADRLLSKRYKNVVLLLLDAMGMNILEKHLSPDGFFRRNLVCAYSSVFPPTTVAATTAADSGLYPNQSAWLGWTGYFDDIDRNVIYYLSIDNDTGERFDYDVARRYVPFDTVRAKIQRAGGQAHYVAPFAEPYPKTYGEICAEITSLCRADGEKYIYTYFDQPDTAMHEQGIDGEEIKDLLSDMEKQTERLAEALEDTLLIITADHGHINIKNESLTDYPDIAECLVRPASMEVRALNLFVKKGTEKRFEEAFNKHFGKNFILFSKAEVMEKKLLGYGENHPKLDKMLGDYLACAVSDTAIRNLPGGHKGNHAGLTSEEMIIPLIAVEK